MADIDRFAHKIAFLVFAGLTERDAQTAMLTSSRFTVGSVLEEQADAGSDAKEEGLAGLPPIEHEAAFEDGLKLIVDSLAQRGQPAPDKVNRLQEPGQCG